MLGSTDLRKGHLLSDILLLTLDPGVWWERKLCVSCVSFSATFSVSGFCESPLTPCEIKMCIV